MSGSIRRAVPTTGAVRLHRHQPRPVPPGSTGKSEQALLSAALSPLLGARTTEPDNSPTPDPDRGGYLKGFSTRTPPKSCPSWRSSERTTSAPESRAASMMAASQ